MKTFTVAKGSGTGNFKAGWQEVTVTKASYGNLDNGARFIDVWFDGFPESFNMRMYEKMSKNGEEFAIANLFRFAENAGVASSTETKDDGKFVVTFDDSAAGLVGKRFNIYLYKNSDGYFRALAKTAPVEFSGIVDTITENDVEYWKGKAEQYYTNWILPNIDSKPAENTDEVPF